MIAAYSDAGVIQQRYVFGPGADEALVEYAGSGMRRLIPDRPNKRGPSLKFHAFSKLSP